MVPTYVIDLTHDSDDDGRQPRARKARTLQEISHDMQLNNLIHHPPASSRPEVMQSMQRHSHHQEPRPSRQHAKHHSPRPRRHVPFRPETLRSMPSPSDYIVDLTATDIADALESQLSDQMHQSFVQDNKPEEPPARICLNCVASGDVTCDGEKPCSACSEPGIECLYPGDRPQSPRQVVPHLALGPSTPHVMEEEPFDDDDQIDTVARFDLDSLEGIRGLLKMHEARMRAHRAYLTQPLLSRSKYEAMHSPVPVLPKGFTNPFAKQIDKAKRGATGTGAQKAPVATLQMRTNKTGAPKKWVTVSVPSVTVRRDPTILPRYKSIGRLGATLLAPNSYVKKYLPYFADEIPEAERKREEDIAKWYQTDHDSMHRQRKCLEAVQLWKNVVENFASSLEIQLKDLLWYVLNSDNEVKCKACDKQPKREKYSATLDLLQKPDEQSLKRAQMATEALNELAKIHMWHIVVELDDVKKILKAVEDRKQPSSTLCSICFVHNCMTHGAFNEPSDETSGTFTFMGSDSARRRPMMINDDEKDVNERIIVAVEQNGQEGSAHQCGLFCVEATTTIKSVLGQKPDGTISGVYNRSTYAPRPAYDNFETCGPLCFWPVERRTRYTTVVQTKSYEVNMSAEEKQLFKKLMGLHACNQRAPCMIAQQIDSIQCIEAFYLILATSQDPAHFEDARHELQQQNMRKLSKVAQGLDTSMSSQLDERPPFLPCSHDGPCQNNPDCTCFNEKVACEFFCGCDADCKRRFQGCSCGGKGKACFSDDRCECWAANRECDPWVCKSCGAVEVLDPANKYREEIRKGRCKNTNIQLDLPARTLKAPSEVQGWGLYAGQDLETHTFIGEYKGEIVGNQESDRRGSIYHHLGQEYLFVTNNGQQIDGSNFGNKTRFINNSQRPEYINVLAKKLLCYGVQRVMLYSRRPIKAGDELLYNYNYPDSVTKTFWERGEGPARVSGAVVAKPVLPMDGRIAKVADKQPRESSESRSRPQNRQAVGSISKNPSGGEGGGSRSSAKRKRVSEGDSFLYPGSTTVTNGHSTGLGESEESEYPGEIPATDEDETGSAEASSEEVDGPVRQRRIHARDGRLGGNAQRKAWETRKNKARLTGE